MYLAHHGIKGQKWGVRRFQNPDGSYTEEGKRRNVYRNRARNAYKTKKDMDYLYNKMSDKDKYLFLFPAFYICKILSNHHFNDESCNSAIKRILFLAEFSCINASNSRTHWAKVKIILRYSIFVNSCSCY